MHQPVLPPESPHCEQSDEGRIIIIPPGSAQGASMAQLVNEVPLG